MLAVRQESTKYSTRYTLMSIISCERVIGSFNETLYHIQCNICFQMNFKIFSRFGENFKLGSSIPRSNLQYFTFAVALCRVIPFQKIGIALFNCSSRLLIADRHYISSIFSRCIFQIRQNVFWEYWRLFLFRECLKHIITFFL